MSTRPRITFDDRGWCNACQWMEEKKSFDFKPRIDELKELSNKYRSTTGNFDCIVPVSGGKDGSYVAYNLKHKYGMNPLAVTVRPALSLQKKLMRNITILLMNFIISLEFQAY